MTEDGIVSELSPEQLRDDLEHTLEVAETMVGVWPFSCTTVAGTPVDGSLTLVAIDRSTLTQWSAVGDWCGPDDSYLHGTVDATFTTSLGDDWSAAILDVYAIRDDGSGAFGVAVYDVAGEQASGHLTWYPDGRIEGEAYWLKPVDSCTWSTTGAPFS